VGADILAQGGNAADAGIAVALALGVLNPQSSGLGGGGFAMYYDAKTKKVTILDFREVAPRLLTPERFVRDGTLAPMLARIGGLAVGVPGEPRGLAILSKKHSRLPWSRLVDPAYKLARDGFDVGYAMQYAAKVAVERLDETFVLRRWLRPLGEVIGWGQRVRRTRLAKTLKALRDGGPGVFYDGWIAKDVLETVRAGGGVMTAADLRGYQVEERDALTWTWGKYEIATMPLPSSGGLALLEMLGILENGNFGLKESGAGSSKTLHVLVEVLKHAFADRARFLGEGQASDVTGMLLAPSRLARLAKRVSKKVRANADYGEKTVKAKAPPKNDTGTSHMCIVDKEGNALALTTTVNGLFGAGLISKESGIVLNNQMDDFSLRAGVPNQFGLIQSEQNLVAPGKRPLSSMSPTLVFENESVVGCVGGSGGPRIISGTFQVLLNSFVFGMNAEASVSAPRVHHQWQPDVLFLEEEIPADVRGALKRRGHARQSERSVGTVQFVRVYPDGVREGASDPRKGGRAAAETLGVRRSSSTGQPL